MIKPAYYNEIDPWAAQLLLNLIAAGHIAPGDVDTRSILDVKPDDIRRYTQHHFFAGAGVWSAALRKAGWHDDRAVCTMSCPCQPFSAAGAGNGFADERHLWPHAHYLIGQLGFKRIYGEQVASKAVDAWLDLVQADLEALGYAFGALAFPSAGVGAPHIRDRTYWMADSASNRRREKRPNAGGQFVGSDAQRIGPGCLPSCAIGQLGHAECQSLALGVSDSRISGDALGTDARKAAERAGVYVGGMADTNGGTDGGESKVLSRSDVGGLAQGDGCGAAQFNRPGPTNGLWKNADWLLCRDGKWRPVEPGTFPLAHGAPARVGRLRAYGNAINLEAACEFIRATMDY